jgi:hypothetical protein
MVPANNPSRRKTEYESLLKRGLRVPSDKQANKLSASAHCRGREEQGVDVGEGGVGGIHAARDVHRRGRADQESGGYEHEKKNDRRRDARDADADDTRVVEAPDVVDGRGGGQTEGGETEEGRTAANVDGTEGGGTEEGGTEGGGSAANVDGTEGGGTEGGGSAANVDGTGGGGGEDLVHGGGGISTALDGGGTGGGEGRRHVGGRRGGDLGRTGGGEGRRHVGGRRGGVVGATV